MYLEELKEILEQYDYHPHSVQIVNKHRMVQLFLSVKYYTIPIKVTVAKLSAKERIVLKVQIDKIDIDDINELQPTLNGLHKMHKRKETITNINKNNKQNESN